VLPSYQKKGIGEQLLRHTIERAKRLDYNAIFIYGNPKYYSRFGFVNSEKYSISTHDGSNFDDFMTLELHKGALNGITGHYYEDNLFNVNKEEVDIFDQGFPFKEKN